LPRKNTGQEKTTIKEYVETKSWVIKELEIWALEKSKYQWSKDRVSAACRHKEDRGSIMGSY
jgi:hypothetical protein